MKTHSKLFLLSAGLFFCACMYGQQIPSKPASYPFFSPLLINPAITGNIDYTSVSLISRVNSAPGAQMAALNSRLMTPGGSALSNFGVGGYLFQDKLPGARDLGVGISAAYHLPLGSSNSSGLAFGLAAKGLYHLVTDAGESVGSATTGFIPNADLGLYYYGSYGFAGISSVNMLGLLSDSISADEYNVPSEHLFYGGLKFVLNRKNGVILEPSLVVSLNDSLLSDPGSSFVPYLKLHMQNASIGTRFQNLDNLAFFLQYHFPRFYAGLFIEYPLNEMIIRRDQVNVELSFGLNLGRNRQSATLLKIPEPLFGSGTELTEKPEEEAKTLAEPEVKKEREPRQGKPVREKTNEPAEAKKEKLAEVKTEPPAEVKADVTAEVKAAEPVAATPAISEPAAKVEEKPDIPEEVVVQKEVTEPEAAQEEETIAEEESEVVVFRVQITSTSKPSTQRSVSIEGKPYEVFEYFYVGAYRQCVGNFRDLDAANAFRSRCRAAGYNQAFVAAFINNERVTDPAVFRR
jgi:hypothetical protein